MNTTQVILAYGISPFNNIQFFVLNHLTWGARIVYYSKDPKIPVNTAVDICYDATPALNLSFESELK
jgi:hypothetical protein